MALAPQSEHLARTPKPYFTKKYEQSLPSKSQDREEGERIKMGKSRTLVKKRVKAERGVKRLSSTMKKGGFQGVAGRQSQRASLKKGEGMSR